VPIHLTPL